MRIGNSIQNGIDLFSESFSSRETDSPSPGTEATGYVQDGIISRHRCGEVFGIEQRKFPFRLVLAGKPAFGRHSGLLVSQRNNTQTVDESSAVLWYIGPASRALTTNVRAVDVESGALGARTQDEGAVWTASRTRTPRAVFLAGRTVQRLVVTALDSRTTTSAPQPTGKAPIRRRSRRTSPSGEPHRGSERGSWTRTMLGHHSATHRVRH